MPKGRSTIYTDQQRFEASVERQGDCWLWVKSVNPKTDYGCFCADATRFLAHRWSYEHYVGPILEGFQVDHLCRIRRCVNPAHLEAVTQQENIRRQFADKTHCINGHEYTPETIYVHKGARQCKICSFISQRARRKINQEQVARERTCVECGDPVSIDLALNARYCSVACRRKVGKRIEKERPAATAGSAACSMTGACCTGKLSGTAPLCPDWRGGFSHA